MSADRTIEDLATHVASANGLDLVVLHGSRATQTTHAGSDWDLAVRHAERALTFDERESIRSAFETALTGPVDVVDLRRADPLLLRTIFDKARPLYSHAGAFDDARLLALHRYEDYRPYLRMEREAVRRALGLDVD